MSQHEQGWRCNATPPFHLTQKPPGVVCLRTADLIYTWRPHASHELDHLDEIAFDVFDERNIYTMVRVSLNGHHYDPTCSDGVFHETVDVMSDKPQDNRLCGRLLHVEEFRQREVPRARRIRLEVKFPDGTASNIRIGLRLLDQAADGPVESGNLVEILHDKLHEAQWNCLIHVI